MSEALPVLYRDEHLIAVNKPSGLLVHRSAIDRHETRFALQIVRDQIGQMVYPVHRLDKPTSGVLVFALSSGCAKQLGEMIAARQMQKHYLAVVRGYAPEHGSIDHPLTEEQDSCTDKKARKGKPAQEALTHFKRLACVELPYQVDRLSANSLFTGVLSAGHRPKASDPSASETYQPPDHWRCETWQGQPQPLLPNSVSGAPPAAGGH